MWLNILFLKIKHSTLKQGKNPIYMNHKKHTYIINIPFSSYAADMRVIRILRERTLGNSATKLSKQIKEQHSEAWLNCNLRYLTDCEQFVGGVANVIFQEPPALHLVPTYKWILFVYSQDILLRLEEIKAKCTSVFGSILKFDSTKKVRWLTCNIVLNLIAKQL